MKHFEMHFFRNIGGAKRIKIGLQTMRLYHIRGIGGCATFFDLFLGPIGFVGRVPFKLPEVDHRIEDSNYQPK